MLSNHISYPTLNDNDMRYYNSDTCCAYTLHTPVLIVRKTANVTIIIMSNDQKGPVQGCW